MDRKADPARLAHCLARPRFGQSSTWGLGPGSAPPFPRGQIGAIVPPFRHLAGWRSRPLVMASWAVGFIKKLLIALVREQKVAR